MKLINKIAISFAVIDLVATGAKSQTFKSDFATQVVLAGGGTDPIHTLTFSLQAGGLNALSLVFPNGNTSSSYVLTSDGAGHLVWTSSSGSVILNGDVTGPAGADTVKRINGSALGSMASVADANMLLYSTVSNSWNPVAMSVDATTTHAGVVTVNGSHAATFAVTGNESIADTLTASGPTTINNNLHVSGNASSGSVLTGSVNSGVLSVAGASTLRGITDTGLVANVGNLYNSGNLNNGGIFDLDTTTGTEGTNTIGNTASTTNINGAVNFTGAVTIPAGDLNLGLADDKFYIGNGSSIATPRTITQDVTINDTGLALVNGSHATTFAVTGNETVADSLTASGPTTINNNLHVTGNASSGSVLTGSEGIIGSLSVGGASTLHGVTDTGVIANVGNLSVVGGANITGNDTIGGNATVGGYQTITGGQQVGGNDTVIGTLYAKGNSNIDASPSTGGSVTIGNSTPVAGDTSTTTMNGVVNFTGPVNIPAGDLNLGLANDKFYIGSVGGIATPQTITQDVSITNGGVATVNSASGTAFSVSHNISVGGGANITGNDTVGGTLGVTGATSLTTLGTSGLATLNTATVTNNLLVSGGSHVVGNDTVGGNATVGGYQTITGGQQIGGNDTVIGTLYANGNSNIDASPSTGGSVTIGNSTPVAGDTSTTTMNGVVNFTGPVNIPAGDLNLGLANDKFYIGSVGGIATPQTITQDVSITNGGVATVHSANGNFKVNGNDTVVGAAAFNNTVNVTGQTTLGSTALASSTVALGTTTGSPIALNLTNSFYQIGSTAAVTVSGIAGANTTAGQIIVLVNTNTTPANTITLTSAPGFTLNGANVVMGDGGSVTLMSTGSNWVLVGAE